MTSKQDGGWVQGLTKDEQGRRLMERERVWVEATETLCRLMETQGVQRAELARRLRVSRATVTQMLSGTRNLTLGTLAEAFHVLGRSLHVTCGPPTDSAWLVDEAELRSLDVAADCWTAPEKTPETRAWSVSAPGRPDPEPAKAAPDGTVAA